MCFDFFSHMDDPSVIGRRNFQLRYKLKDFFHAGVVIPTGHEKVRVSGGGGVSNVFYRIQGLFEIFCEVSGTHLSQTISFRNLLHKALTRK